jgi:hypothetical protein
MFENTGHDSMSFMRESKSGNKNESGKNYIDRCSSPAIIRLQKLQNCM